MFCLVRQRREDNEESPEKNKPRCDNRFCCASVYSTYSHPGSARRKQSETGIIYTQIGLIFGLFNAHYVKWVLFRTFVTAGRHLSWRTLRAVSAEFQTTIAVCNRLSSRRFCLTCVEVLAGEREKKSEYS